MIPLSNETIDRQGNHSRLWVLKNEILFGIVLHFDGKISFIPSNKIINSCTNNPISPENLKKLKDLQIDLAYISKQKKLIVFPHLRAAGKDDQIMQIAAKSLNPKLPASWIPFPFNETPDKLGHMFIDKDGHFSEDTPGNRAYIRTAVSDPSNREAINRHGVELYAKIMPDGYRAWAYVRNGLITDGGRDNPWKKWVANPDPKGPGGRVLPRSIYTSTSEKFTFQERVQAECITKVYNASIRNNPWKPHPTEPRGTPRDVGGVRQQTGIILDLLKELEEGVYDEYMFFLPATEGENLLSKEEVLQIIREIAKGIYIHDTVPFFSLNANSDHQLYPIVHPAYQNTYIGHVISMLDYYLKGFWSGQLFEEGFIEQWNKDPKTEEEFLRDHSFPIKEFASFDVTLQNLLKGEEISPETIASMSNCQVAFSCRMIGKQKEINKTENLFVLDADVELVYTVEWKPVGKEQEAYFRILDQACGILCKQIKEKGFAMPVMKKWLDALKIMNFFSCYFRTLQEGDKIPRFQEQSVLDKEKVCPPIFPPIPYPRGPFVEFDVENVFAGLSLDEKKSLKEYCQTKKENTSQKECVKSALVNVLKNFSVEKRSDKQLSEEELLVFADAMMNALRTRYLSTDKHIEKLLIDLKIKAHADETLSEDKILSRVNAALFQVYTAMGETRAEISWKKFFWRSFDEETKLLEELQKVEKIYDVVFSWLKDPLKLVADNDKWFFDLDNKTLGIRTKTSDDEAIKVFGGYEPTLEDMESKESVLASYILQTHRKQLSQLGDEEFFSLGKKTSGYLFKLPIEDSFPISSHGIPYNTMMLMSPVKDASDEALLSVIHAIGESNEEAFRGIEKDILDWNRLDAFGKNLVHYAAAADSSFFLRTLIDKKANLLVKDPQGWTALHYATGTGNLNNLELLLHAEKSLLNIPALNGESPVYLAVQKNQLSCVKKLLEAEVDLSLKPMHGWNVLMSAIHNGHEAMALLLIKTGKINLEFAWRGGKAALHFAIEMRMERVLKELLKLGVDRNRIYNGQSPLALASEQNWQKGIDLLNSSVETENQSSWCSVM